MTASPSRSKDNPWKLKTPPGTSDYTIDDLCAMLKQAGDWVELGGADEQKLAKDGSVEAWARSEANPLGAWYGLKKGLCGRFAVYLPPLMEELGLCEVEHNAKNNRMRII